MAFAGVTCVEINNPGEGMVLRLLYINIKVKRCRDTLLFVLLMKFSLQGYTRKARLLLAPECRH